MPDSTAANTATTHELALTALTRQYNVAGKPDTQGPGENDTTVIPESVIVATYGNPGIADYAVVDVVTVRGRSTFRGTAPGRTRDVAFSAASAHPIPDWITTLLADEGLRYGK